MLTYSKWENPNIEFAIDEQYKGALEVIKWSYGEYGKEIVYACSFGIEGIVLIDLIAKVQPDAQIVFLDTDVHFKETYETIERVREKYPKLHIVLKNLRSHWSTKHSSLVISCGKRIQTSAVIFEN